MASWGQTLEEIIDGITLPQFRRLSRMRQRRIFEERRWSLYVTSFLVQTEEQAKALQEALEECEDATLTSARAEMGGGFTVSKSYPLLHELTPQMVAGNKNWRRLVRFVTVGENDNPS